MKKSKLVNMYVDQLPLDTILAMLENYLRNDETVKKKELERVLGKRHKKCSS